MLVQPSPTFSEPSLELLRRSSGLLPGVWRQLRKNAPGLASAAILLAINFCASLLGLCFDNHVITGLRAWDKPAKFSFSTLIFAVTLGATLQWIRKWRWLTSIAEKLTGAAIILEIAIIDLQAARHMVLPTPQQLAEGRATGRMPIIGSHTVGAPDGGAGLPFLGWSADHGDLRIAHFIGIHGLQVLPVLALFTQRYADQRRRMRLLCWASSAIQAYSSSCCVKRSGGQSILKPDTQWLASFLGLVLMTFLVALAILRSPDTAFRLKRERGTL